MKAKVKRTAAGNLYGGLSTLCGVTCHFKRCEKNHLQIHYVQDLAGKKAMIQQAYIQLCLSANLSVQSTAKVISVEVDHR